MIGSFTLALMVIELTKTAAVVFLASFGFSETLADPRGKCERCERVWKYL